MGFRLVAKSITLNDLERRAHILRSFAEFGIASVAARGADPGGAGGAAAPPILILVVQTYHFAPPIIPVHK